MADKKVKSLQFDTETFDIHAHAVVPAADKTKEISGQGTIVGGQDPTTGHGKAYVYSDSGFKELVTDTQLDTAKQAAIDAANEYTRKQFAPSPVSLYNDAEKIKDNIVYAGNQSDISTYVENGYAYIRDTHTGDYRAGIKITDGVVYLDYNIVQVSLNGGIPGVNVLIGELDAVKDTEYSFPKVNIYSSKSSSSSSGFVEEVSLYIANLDNTGNKVQGEFVQVGVKINQSDSSIEYPYGYHDAFTFTAPETKKYGIWIHIRTNDFYWSVVNSGVITDLSSIAGWLGSNFATKDETANFATTSYVDNAVANSSSSGNTGALINKTTYQRSIAGTWTKTYTGKDYTGTDSTFGSVTISQTNTNYSVSISFDPSWTWGSTISDRIPLATIKIIQEEKYVIPSLPYGTCVQSTSGDILGSWLTLDSLTATISDIEGNATTGYRIKQREITANQTKTATLYLVLDHRGGISDNGQSTVDGLTASTSFTISNLFNDYSGLQQLSELVRKLTARIEQLESNRT